MEPSSSSSSSSPSRCTWIARSVIPILLGTSCILLAYDLGRRSAAENRKPVEDRPGVPSLGTRDGLRQKDGENNSALGYPFPIPDRIEPVGRPPEVEDYLTGAEIMHLLEAAGYRLETAPTAPTAALALTSTEDHHASTNESATVIPEAQALRDGWNGMSTNGERCASIDMSVMAPGMACGAPLGQPCFDHDRCRPQALGGSGMSIYVFDGTCSLANSSALPPSDESLMLSHTWREVARDAGVLSESYWDACLFLHVNKLMGPVPCPAERPLWNGGMNHVMVDLTDRTRDEKLVVAESVAMDASSNMHTCFYRSGYDFAVPLRHKMEFSGISHIAPWHRKYFLTVKGSLYLSGKGSDERMSVVPLHSEPDGVVMALNCFEFHGEHLLPENEKFCVALNATASHHEYEELMNTTFGLVPAGRSPATYRLAEVMSAGAIPVFVARDMVRPFPERVDWPSLSFSFTPEEVGPAMMATLRSVPPVELLAMQRKSLAAFLDIFGEEPGYDRIARVVIDELASRVGHH